MNGDLSAVVKSAVESDHRRAQIVYKNVCARFRSLNDGRNATSMARVPGVAHLLGSAIMEKHGMPVLVTTTTTDVVAVSTAPDSAAASSVSVSSVQDHIFGSTVTSDGSKVGDHNRGSSATSWAAVVESVQPSPKGGCQVVVQSTLPMHPTVLGHADAMRAAIELACGSAQDSTRGVPVLHGGEVALLSSKGDSAEANATFWDRHRLVYAVVPQSSGETWNGSNGDFEAVAAAAIVAKKYSYDIGSETPRLGDVKAVAERDGRPRPAQEWDTLMSGVLDKMAGYTAAEIKALGCGEAAPSSSSVFKLQQYTRFFFGEAYRAMAAEKDLGKLGPMMDESDRAMREMGLYCSQLERTVVDAARSAGALGARVIPSVVSGQGTGSNSASVVVALVAAGNAESVRDAMSGSGRGLESWLEVPGTAGCTVKIDSFLSHDDDTLDEILAQHHLG